MRALLDDLAFTARTLRSNIRFTVAVTLILALGIGANSAIFSLVDAALFRGLQVERPHELVRVFSSERQRVSIPTRRCGRSRMSLPRSTPIFR